MYQRRKILGINFFVGSAAEAVDAALGGGLVVVPAAPALVEMKSKPDYTDALVNSDVAITDSSAMVLIWKVLTGEKLIRVSGLEYLNILLAKPELKRAGSVVWVMPTAKARDMNLGWLRANGHPTTEDDCYLAPKYSEGPINDPRLLAFVKDRQPRHVIVALGGGVQERVGLFLKRELSFRPGIHCIGAAIGFLSGEQVRIPLWVDYIYLGWLWRCFSAPTKFIPRYWRARKLLALMWRYRDRLPLD